MSRKEDIMNCDDYQTAVSADPGFSDASGHADGCASCRDFQDDMLALNDKIASADDARVA